jgi:hypothetical protein
MDGDAYKVVVLLEDGELVGMGSAVEDLCSSWAAE